MTVNIQVRRDTAANWTSVDPTLALGEVGKETDTLQQKTGDGTTAWTSLPYDPFVPAGGTSGQRLAKSSGTDYDVGWVTPADAGVDLTGDSGSATGISDITFSGADVTDDGGGAATVTVTGSGGLTDPPTITYIDATGAAAPGNPASGTARIYAKTDGRVYSRDNAGVEYGPFDAAGGGGTLYAVDETFPGSSLPAGWTFTGSGSATVSGGKVAVNCTAQSDRLMFAHTFSTGNHIIRARIKNYSGTRGGMVGLGVFDASGHGYVISPYSDGHSYFWTASSTAYQYTGTNKDLGTSPSLTDVWWELFISGGSVVGGAFSTDGGVTWAGFALLSPSTLTLTQVGICRLFTTTESMDLYELTCTEP